MSRLNSIIEQLKEFIPQYTTMFSDRVTINSITKSGDTVTVTTATSHGLTTNDEIVINGAKNKVAITTLTQTGGVATATTTNEHDLTFNKTNIAQNIIKSVTIEGCNESAYNGTFDLTEVTDRNNFKFTIDSGAPASATGSPALLENHNMNYNGKHTITVIDTTIFTYTIINDYLSTPAGGSPYLNSGVRISGDATIERVISAYASHPSTSNIISIDGEQIDTGKMWLFAILNDANISKDRKMDNDSSNLRTGSDNFQMLNINNFSLYLFLPTKKQVSGRLARDIAEDLLKPVYKSILRFEVPSPFISDNFSIVTPLGHGYFSYNSAYYIHKYDFEFVDIVVSKGITDDDLGSGGDTIPIATTRALRRWENKAINEFEEIVKDDVFDIN